MTDWMKAEPIDVEREVRRRLGIPRGNSVIGPFTKNIAAVLRDVLPRMKTGRELSHFYILCRQEPEKHLDDDGVTLGWLMEDYIDGDACPEILHATWETLDEMPLAICRAFCQLPEGGK